MDTTESVYPSQVDRWLAVVLIGGPLSILGLGIYLLTLHLWAGVYCLFTGLFVGLLMYVLCVPCRYTLKADHLHIQAGLLHDKVPYTEILEATPTRNPLSAPALSLDRVKIHLAKGSFPGYKLISPAQKDKFLAELTSRIEAQPPTPV